MGRKREIGMNDNSQFINLIGIYENHRWNRYTVQAFLNVRVGVINGTLEQDFRKWHRNFRPINAVA
jgi:hypothetical protein